jgi:hypothetical protein
MLHTHAYTRNNVKLVEFLDVANVDILDVDVVFVEILQKLPKMRYVSDKHCLPPK